MLGLHNFKKLDATTILPQVPDTVSISSRDKPAPIQEFRTVCWFFGVCFFILTVALIQVDIISGYYGVVMRIIAGLLLPPVRDWAYGITSTGIPTWVKTLIIFSLIMYSGDLIQTNAPTSTSQQQQEEATTSALATVSKPEEQ